MRYGIYYELWSPYTSDNTYTLKYSRRQDDVGRPSMLPADLLLLPTTRDEDDGMINELAPLNAAMRVRRIEVARIVWYNTIGYNGMRLFIINMICYWGEYELDVVGPCMSSISG